MSDSNQPKPGYKTTEFWLSLAAVLFGALASSGVFDSLGTDHWVVKVVGIVTSVLGALGYTVARGVVKGSTVKNAALAAIAEKTKDPQ